MASFPSKCLSLFTTAIQQSQTDIPMKIWASAFTEGYCLLVYSTKETSIFYPAVSKLEIRRQVKISSCSQFPLPRSESLGSFCMLPCGPNSCASPGCYTAIALERRLRDAADCQTVPCELPSLTQLLKTEESWSWGAASLSPTVVLLSTGKLFYSM